MSMNREIQQSYVRIRNTLSNRLKEFNSVADMIAEKYDYDDDEQFDLMCDEQDEIREEMGITSIENELFRLENLLLEDFKKYIENQKDLHNIGDIHELFNEGLKLHETRSKLIELALRS